MPTLSCRRATAVLLLPLAVAACSSPPSSSATRPKTVVVAASSSPSPTEQVATVRQYASAVSPPIKAIRGTWASYRSHVCTPSSDPGDLTCGLAPLTLNVQAHTLIVTLTGAATPGVATYIGKPPAELEKLVADTLNAAQGLLSVTDANNKGTSAQVLTAGTTLMTVLDRWDPYLGGTAWQEVHGAGSTSTTPERPEPRVDR